jgi:hypothetical protein
MWLLPPALALVVVSLLLVTPRGDSDPSVTILGRTQIVFDWSRMACEPNHYPDAPTRAFRDSEGRVQLIMSAPTNRRMIGPNLNHLRPSCDPIMYSHLDARPASFDDREWIASLYTRDGRQIFALIHNEYQGHQHPGRCPSGQYKKCWYNSITLAVSTDRGGSFTHARAARHLVASVPYRYAPNRGPFGVFSPSIIVYRSEDRNYYAMVALRRYRDQPAGTCLIRTRHLADPRSWRAWDGEEFGVSFIDPYGHRSGPATKHVCRPVGPKEIQLMAQSLTFNTYFDQYLLVGRSALYSPRKRRLVSGVYFSLSRDLINWSRRRLIMEAELVQTHRCHDPDPIGYPVVLDPASRSRNFGTTGKRVYLYFTKFHYVSCRPTPNRDLVRIPIEFSK